MLTKDQLPQQIVTARTIIRRAAPEDLPRIAAWPDYAQPYADFSMTRAPRSEDGRYWWERVDAPDRCHYSVVLPAGGKIVGVHAFVRIDWPNAAVGNMGIRIHPDLCDKGYGTETLRPLLAAVLESGIQSIRLDVSPVNPRAIRCYENCGMRIVDEFWREHKGEAIDPADPKWTSLLPHLKREGDKWTVRFYWMEIRRSRD